MIDIRYDPEADAIYIALRARRRVARTVAATPSANVDVDRKGLVVGIEILNASRHVDADSLGAIAAPEHWLTLRQAARVSGLKASTLRQLVNRGRLRAQKRGRDWFVDGATLLNYLETRDSRGRPATNPRARRRRPAA